MTTGKILLLGCLVSTGAYAGPVLVTSLAALGATDSATWGQLGGDQTVLGASFSANSVNSKVISGAFANGAGSVVSVVCPAAPSCSWIPSGSGFAAGDSVIVTSNATGGSTGPLSLTFPAVKGAGLEIQVDIPGTFTAQLLAFNGATQIGPTFTLASNAAGDPLFIGALDTTADITKITVNLSACGGLGCNVNDFAADTLYLNASTGSTVPEPSSMLLLGGALAAVLGWRGRQRLRAPARILPVHLVAAVLLCAATAAFAQDDVGGPLNVISDAQAVQSLRANSQVLSSNSQVSSFTPLPIGLYSVVAYDGNTYQGEIVGRSPFARGLRTTTVNVVLIPLIVKTPSTSSGNFTSDPTSPDSGCLGGSNTALSLTQASPILNQPPTPFTMNGVTVGGLTFLDAHLRGEFWNLVGAGGNAFHLALPFTTAATQTLDATAQPFTNAFTLGYGGTHCGVNSGSTNNKGALSSLNINYLDPILQNIISNLGITPNQFPFFVIYRTVITNGAANNTGNCCILGYHNNENNSSSIQDPGQTYGISLFNTGDVFGFNTSVMAHEGGEWINDPGGVNPTPIYSSGQTASCAQGGQNNLEVGDPLSGISNDHQIMMPNGVNYFLQELAYFSWFYSADHAGSLGAGTCAGLGSGCMSSNGTFKGPARPCPTGGTYPN
jgi:hypothetical protein